VGHLDAKSETHKQNNKEKMQPSPENNILVIAEINHNKLEIVHELEGLFELMEFKP
jgi:hypothetical protein